MVGLPALRVKGIYLGIATLSFGFIVEEVLARWESVTGGNAVGTGCHLHFEIHVHGVAVDPTPALRRWDRYS